MLKQIILSSNDNGKAREINVAVCCIAGDPNLLEVAGTWPAEVQCEMRAAVQRDMQVLPDFVTEQEEASLLAELEPVLKKMRYEFDHWDNVSNTTIKIILLN